MYPRNRQPHQRPNAYRRPCGRSPRLRTSPSRIPTARPLVPVLPERQTQMSRGAHVLDYLLSQLNVYQYLLRIMREPCNRPYCVGDIRPCLIRDPRQTPTISSDLASTTGSSSLTRLRSNDGEAGVGLVLLFRNVRQHFE